MVTWWSASTSFGSIILHHRVLNHDFSQWLWTIILKRLLNRHCEPSFSIIIFWSISSSDNKPVLTRFWLSSSKDILGQSHVYGHTQVWNTPYKGIFWVFVSLRSPTIQGFWTTAAILYDIGKCCWHFKKKYICLKRLSWNHELAVNWYNCSLKTMHCCWI